MKISWIAGESTEVSVAPSPLGRRISIFTIGSSVIAGFFGGLLIAKVVPDLPIAGQILLGCLFAVAALIGILRRG